MTEFKWGGYRLPVASDDANEPIDLSSVDLVAPKNLRVATFPYPHLRDDDGCVIARDFMDLRKLAYILAALQPEARPEGADQCPDCGGHGWTL
jgi:hypothetical protein